MTKNTGKILIIEDDPEMCRLLDTKLTKKKFSVSWYTSADQGHKALNSEIVDVILTDINLPGISGLELCRQCSENYPDIPVVIMTAFGSMETAISAIRAGAYDFITKPVDLDILALSLKRAVEHRQLQEKVRLLSDALGKTQPFDDLIGESKPMKDLFPLLTRISDTDISVLITGESGSGKELFAKAIHNHSQRKNDPMITVNCSAMPETLLESELFGHVRGAFTDAKSDRKGLFQEAEGGTLFLDEIGELPLPLQPKLLRAIEERCIRPVGSNVDIPYDARIITATNRNLEEAVILGTFREDLLYRLNVFHLEMPPLRIRDMDILLLAKHFLKQFSQSLKKNVNEISPKAAEKLLNYNWPGNVRELRNAMEHAVALAGYDVLVPEDFPKKIRGCEVSLLPEGIGAPMELVSMQEMERRYILHVLKETDGNRSAAAGILKLDRKTLYRKLRSYGIET